MPFPKMTAKQYPPRMWCLYGAPDTGKSTFVAAMQTPLLVIDADERFEEVLHRFPNLQVYAVSDQPQDHTDPNKIALLLDLHMPTSDAKTIVIDSVTSIIAPRVSKAILEADRARELKKHGQTAEGSNLMAGFKDKALAMRQLQDAVSKWGRAVVYVYHIYEARDASSNKVVRASLPETERARLVRSINMQVQLLKERGRYGAQVTWARYGRSGAVLWDEKGNWEGMPERIEQAVYGGLSEDDQKRIASQPPEAFPNAATAIAWGFETGAFNALEHSRNAYNKLKETLKPGTAKEMRDAWVGEIQRRLKELAQAKPTGENEDGDQDSLF